jgi:uncharacterized membrane protein YhiD involved in acid resistance
VAFSKLETFILSHSRNVNLYVEFEDVDNVTEILSSLKDMSVRIFDVEISKQSDSESQFPNAILTLRLPPKTSHTKAIATIAQISSVRAIKEL